MAVSEKKSRIRKLPPKLQIVEESAITGSYPMKARSAVVDNRTGLFLSPFDDQRATQIFAATSSLPEMSYTSSLTSVPYIPGQDLAPFREMDQWAADETAQNKQFWATGSQVETFDGPLWSKNRIEIDLTPSSQTAITASGGGGYEAVFNFNTRTWQSSSYGTVPDDVITLPNQYKAINYGFTPSYHPHVTPNYHLQARGKPFSNFGFPSMWPVYDEASFHMSQVLNRPFVLEKIYVEISASYIKGAGLRGPSGSIPDLFLDGVAYDSDNLYGPSSFLPQVSNSYVVNNFFILNKRMNARKDIKQIKSYENSSELKDYYFEPTQISNRNNVSGSDLVTWFEIASFNDNYGYVAAASADPSNFYRDVTIVDASSNDAFFSSWSQNLQMSGGVRVPNSANFLDQNVNTIFDYQGLTARYLTAGWIGGRSGLDDLSQNGRDFKRANKNAVTGSAFEDFFTETPYLLLPTDKLSFRWQMPVPETNNSFIFNPNITIVSSSYLVFPAYRAKVVLYGSFISEGMAINDSLNQLLSSENIHEEI